MFPKTSRAAVLRTFEEPLLIEDVKVPQVLEPGALLVRVEASSVCGTDIHQWQGRMHIPMQLPVILGHEICGKIVGFGQGADVDSVGQKLSLGDRVIWDHATCGSCYHCSVERRPALCDNRRLYGYANSDTPPYLLGGFSEYAYVLPGSGKLRVPESVESGLASMASCALRTVMNAFEIAGAINSSDSVLIQGSGPLGILACAVAKSSGAKKVIVIGAPQNRLDLCDLFGADTAISFQDVADEDDRRAMVYDLTEGRGADIVFEFSGNPVAVSEGMQLARRGGRYVVVGQSQSKQVPIDPSRIVARNLTILGCYSASISHYWKALEFLRTHSDEFPFGDMVSDTYALADINSAFESMREMTSIKPVILP